VTAGNDRKMMMIMKRAVAGVEWKLHRELTSWGGAFCVLKS
jgi:hypothetical protein